MKKLNLLLFIVYSLIITNCSFQSQKKMNIVKFYKQKSKRINIENGIKFFPLSYYEKKDSVFIVLNNDKQLTTYSLETGEKINEININYFKYQSLMSYKYLNKDSIILLFNSSSISNYNYHDSAFMIINNQGEIKKIFNFKDTPVRCSYNNIKSSFETMTIPSAFSDIYFSDNKVFFSISRQYIKPGDSISESVNLPYGGHYDLIDNKLITYNKLNHHPYFAQGRYYKRLYSSVFITMSNKKLPIYGFRHTSIIYEYDYKKDVKHQHKLKSALVDTIKPDTVYMEKYVDTYNAQYNNFYYDKYRKIYYRFVTLAAKKDETPFRKNHRKISMLVADTNFNKIAEGILPDNLHSIPFLITKEGIWFHNSADKENITFDLYTLKYKKGTKQDLVKEYNEKTEAENKDGVLPFMNNLFKVKAENSLIVIVPTDLGCHSCASTISKFYVENQTLFKNKNLYFVIAGIAKFTVDPFIEHNDLKGDMPNLFIDKKGEYLNYIEGFNNPKLLILENGKVKFDKVYSPSELIELEIKIKEYSER